ncbi:choline ABC transporter ATP-binding protein [Rhodoligotrophos defluvii]|uniref:choline ABC transporter ATP-binding protein n=1 Tax=Rhodoligotrophos defluvii TaxID=2561934 RepID=UPI0010C9DFD0|nr:choline ABC transporter ATP-binding protein [Rhodoligotrophos defluvii]
MNAAAVSFENVDIIFGKQPERALALLDQGASRAEVLEQTGTVVGVADASLEVAEGEICVLMGLSGSGKSTLIRAVNGLNKPVRGRVLVRDGGETVDVTTCSGPELRQVRMHCVAMVFQQFALLPWRTVAENVGFGLELAGVPQKERHERVRQQLKLVHLEKWADKYAHELSGGMQQRVGLARAFATNAPILLMDEPFSALDPLIRTHLQDELLEFQRTLRKTILFVSHDLDEALKLGNRIAIMEEARIVQCSTPRDIVLKPASDYVAQFVAHMNPLNVLDGYALMTPIEKAAPEAAARAASLPAIPAASSMREIIDVRRTAGGALALTEGGRIIGLVGDGEIYEGLLRRATAS